MKRRLIRKLVNFFSQAFRMEFLFDCLFRLLAGLNNKSEAVVTRRDSGVDR